MKNLNALVLAGVVTIAGAQAFAEVSLESVPQTTTTSNTLMDVLNDKAVLRYWGYYRGGPVGDPGNSLQPQVNGLLDNSNGQSFENFVTTGYKLQKDLYVGVASHFFYYPVGNRPDGRGQDFKMLDPSLVIAKENWIDRSGFKLTGKFFVTIPATSVDFLQKNSMATSFSPTAIMSYDVPKTALTLGVYSYITAYVPTSSTLDTARTYKLIAAPNASYQLTKTVALTAWYDFIQVTRNGGTGFLSGMNNDTTDIEPGVSWDITKNITVNPCLNIYPTNPTLASTSIQAVVIAKAF